MRFERYATQRGYSGRPLRRVLTWEGHEAARKRSIILKVSSRGVTTCLRKAETHETKVQLESLLYILYSLTHAPSCTHIRAVHRPVKVFTTVYGCLAGLGRLRVLDDEVLMQILGLLPADALARLACVNQALYCFANHEDLWRALTLEVSSPPINRCAADSHNYTTCPAFVPTLRCAVYSWCSY